jgi:hypothetical protein
MRFIMGMLVFLLAPCLSAAQEGPGSDLVREAIRVVLAEADGFASLSEQVSTPTKVWLDTESFGRSGFKDLPGLRRQILPVLDRSVDYSRRDSVVSCDRTDLGTRECSVAGGGIVVSLDRPPQVTERMGKVWVTLRMPTPWSGSPMCPMSMYLEFVRRGDRDRGAQGGWVLTRKLYLTEC